MVKIAVPGGSGDVARVVIDALVATGKHEIVVLSRNDAPPPGKEVKGAAWAKVDYADKAALVEVLKGVHTVLSFTVNTDPANIVQKTLIDASVEAGVKRYAPSEWAS
ncbi:hypothetical protein VTK73DRAFT_9226 [Phialemonium thermophilum]|uniref:NmrA-like domain-containing protein n=1 Tax=Phialemonium thermophilum TaxID=223376 RepID=A0ABR3W490_9PEZI